MNSIHRRLLVSLSLVWTTVWVAVALVSMDRSGHEVGELMDAQLAQTAHVYRQLIKVGHLPNIAGKAQPLSPIGHPYESMISFQLWRNDMLIGTFGAAPAEPLARQSGFSDQVIAETQWRIFGLPTDTQGEIIYVAQSYAIRQELIDYLTVHAIRPVLWSLPLTVLLIWLAIADGLRPLNRLARDIGRRSADQLQPIAASRVPYEIQPVTNALNGLMERLQETLEAERHFAADASHELRTPFAIIRTHAQIAQRSNDPHERAEALGRLIRGVDRATHLISQLLTLSRLKHRVLDAEDSASSLSKAVMSALEEIRGSAQAKAIELKHRLPDTDPCMVCVSSSALAILIGNLLSNAIKFTPEGGRVGVAVVARRERILLRVEDSGRGIPPRDRERVFARFYRRGEQNEPGAGLGLSIVRGICELHDAEIELLDGENGRGLLVEVAFRKTA